MTKYKLALHQNHFTQTNQQTIKTESPNLMRKQQQTKKTQLNNNKTAIAKS